MDRRTFITATSAAALGIPAFLTVPRRLPTPPIKAVLFDAFPIFDPRPIGALLTRLFADRGPALLAAWRARQFEYTWLRTAAGRYRDFWIVTRQAFTSATRSLGLTATPAQEAAVMDAYLHLPAWPDVPGALQTLKDRGLRVGFLSNFTEEMLKANLISAGLQGQFDYVLSTDRVQQFKPAPEAYQLGLAATGLPREQIVFTAFAGWDAAGAKWFGYPTVWVNRLQTAAEELDATPDQTGPDLQALISFLGR